MHIVLSILMVIGTVLFLLSRVARSANDLADAANEISNLPRKLRYRKKAGKRGLDLVEGPIEAATVLMISIARLDGLGRVSDIQEQAIIDQLIEHMQLAPEAAADMVLHMRSLTTDLKQADTALFPMVKILQQSVDAEDTLALARMMESVGGVSNELSSDQTYFIRRFKDRMGVGV